MAATTLWTRDFTLVTVASALGAIGSIAGGFALSFLVFDETGSTLASALVLAIQLVPYFVVPIAAAPWMDRLPRKPFLVAGDCVNGVLYALAGLYLMSRSFSYVGYLVFSLVISSLRAFDELAYNSMYPKLIPQGMEQRGYTVSSMLYPVMNVVMMPAAGVLYETVGVGWVLVAQGCLSAAAAAVESRIRVREERRMNGERASLSLWWADVREAARYLRDERGLANMYAYQAVTNGVASGYAPLLVAYFSTAPGLSPALYALFSVAEFVGRSLGGVVQYRLRVPDERKFGICFGVYNLYELMDMALLWLPYPLMLANRAVVGFCGINSATLRQAAVQTYLPDELRARMNAFEGAIVMAGRSVLTLVVGALGEVLDVRACMTIAAGCALAVCWATVWRARADVRKLFEAGAVA